MSKTDLKQYQKRKQLIAAYRAELDGDMTASDSVTGSMAEHPYVEHVIPIQGRNVERGQYLRQRIYALSQGCARAEAFVAGVSDEQMRALLFWHYIRGLSWPKVRKAMRMRDVTADCLRIRTERFFSKKP